MARLCEFKVGLWNRLCCTLLKVNCDVYLLLVWDNIICTNTKCDYKFLFTGWWDSLCGLDATEGPGHRKNTKYVIICLQTSQQMYNPNLITKKQKLRGPWNCLFKKTHQTSCKQKYIIP